MGGREGEGKQGQTVRKMGGEKVDGITSLGKDRSQALSRLASWARIEISTPHK